MSIEMNDLDTFPPRLDIGHRVWTDEGYRDHGPASGPKVDISAHQGGTISKIEKPYYTMDHLLYVVHWDNGEKSRHYATELFGIGHFQTRTAFEAAIKIDGTVEVTLGPAGGFRSAQLELDYDGRHQTVKVIDRNLWLKCLEPLVRRSGVSVSEIKLKAKDRARKMPK